MNRLALLTFLLCLSGISFAQIDPSFEKATGINYYDGVPVTAPPTARSVELGWVWDSSALYYFNRTDLQWRKITANGEPGADGNTVRSGTGVPAGALGVDGDFYIDTDNLRIYGPKSGGVWGVGRLLIGPAGPAGPPGAGVIVKDTVPTQADLPLPYTGDIGDGFISSDNSHLHIWQGIGWLDVGPIQGPPGAPGDDGLAATIAVGTVTTGAAGSSASVSNAGTPAAAVFNFTIPRGNTGLTGATGAAGSNGLGWTSGSYNPATGVVTFSSDDGLTFSTGDIRGAAGAAGNDGDAATVAVGTVTTGAAGSSAAITNAGTSSAAVFNFTIPRGNTGLTGATGATGAAGANGQGWTSGSYNAGTGVVTFFSADGLGFATGDLRGAAGTNGTNGADGNGIASASYNASTGVLTLTYTNGGTSSTGDLRGATGPAGPSDWNAIPNVPDSIVYTSELQGVRTELLDTVYNTTPVQVWNNVDALAEFTLSVAPEIAAGNSVRILKIGDSNTNSEESSAAEYYQTFIRSLGYADHPETVWTYNDGASRRIGIQNLSGGTTTIVDEPSAISRKAKQLESVGAFDGYRIPYTVDYRDPGAIHFYYIAEPGAGTVRSVLRWSTFDLVPIDSVVVTTNLNLTRQIVKVTIPIQVATTFDGRTIDVFARKTGGGNVKISTIITDARAATVEYSSIGVGGSQLNQWMTQFRDPLFLDILRDADIDLFILQLGSNDMPYQSCDELQGLMREAIDTLRGIFYNRLVVVASPHRIPGVGDVPTICDATNMERRFFLETQKRNVPLFSINQLFGTQQDITDNALLEDIVHWGARGHTMNAAAMLRPIIPALIEPEDPATSWLPTADGIIYSGGVVETGNTTVYEKNWPGTEQRTYRDLYRFKPTGTGILIVMLPEDPPTNFYVSVEIEGYAYNPDQGGAFAKAEGLHLNSTSTWTNSSAIAQGQFFGTGVVMGNYGGKPCIIFGSKNTMNWGNFRYIEVSKVMSDGVVPLASGWSHAVVADLTGVTQLAIPFDQSSPPIGGYNPDAVVFNYYNPVSKRVGGNFVALKIPANINDRFEGTISIVDYSGVTGESVHASVDFSFLAHASVLARSAIIRGRLPGNSVFFGRTGNDFYVVLGDGADAFSTLSVVTVSRLTASGANGKRYAATKFELLGLADLTSIVDVLGTGDVKVASADNLGNHTATTALNMASQKVTNLATPTATTDATTKAYVDAQVAAVPVPNLQTVTNTGAITTNITTLQGLRVRGGGAATEQIRFGFSTTDTYAHTFKTRHNGGADTGNNIDLFTWNFGTDAIATPGTFRAATFGTGNSEIASPLTLLAPLAMSSQKITALATGTAGTDAVNKAQMDAAITAGADGVTSSAAFTGTTTKTLTLARTAGLPNLTATFTDNVDDADNSPTNEIQTLSLSGSNLTISSGNTVALPSGADGNGLYSADGTISAGRIAQGYDRPAGVGGVLGRSELFFAKNISGNYYTGFKSFGTGDKGFELQSRVTGAGDPVSAALTLSNNTNRTTLSDGNWYYDNGTQFYGFRMGATPAWRVGTTSFLDLPTALPTQNSVWQNTSTGTGQWVTTANSYERVLPAAVSNSSTSVYSTIFTIPITTGKTYSGTIKLWWLPTNGESIQVRLSPVAGTISGSIVDLRDTGGVSALDSSPLTITDYAGTGKSSTTLDFTFTATNTTNLLFQFKKLSTGLGFAHDVEPGTMIILKEVTN